MDLSRLQSDLSLALNSHAAPIADESIALQVDRVPFQCPRSIPLQLFDEHSVNLRTGEELEDRNREEEFSILGFPMCLKRQIRCESTADPDLETRRSTVRSWGNQPLAAADPDVLEIMEKEKDRQVKGIELVALENFVCRAVLEALGSHLTNKYSEGMPNQCKDQIERICCDRALAAFDLDPESWGVNVQPYSCTSANFAVYAGLLMPKDRIMGLDFPSGGHVSHGYYAPGGKKMSGASIFFESHSYKVNPQNGYIDCDKLEEREGDGFSPEDFDLWREFVPEGVGFCTDSADCRQVQCSADGRYGYY